MKMVWVLLLITILAVVDATPPGIANNPSNASCKKKEYKECYNLVHVCPKFCPDSCHVECASCKPICGPEPPELSPPTPVTPSPPPTTPMTPPPTPVIPPPTPVIPSPPPPTPVTPSPPPPTPVTPPPTPVIPSPPPPTPITPPPTPEIPPPSPVTPSPPPPTPVTPSPPPNTPVTPSPPPTPVITPPTPATPTPPSTPVITPPTPATPTPPPTPVITPPIPATPTPQPPVYPPTTSPSPPPTIDSPPSQDSPPPTPASTPPTVTPPSPPSPPTTPSSSPDAQPPTTPSPPVATPPTSNPPPSPSIPDTNSPPSVPPTPPTPSSPPYTPPSTPPTTPAHQSPPDSTDEAAGRRRRCGNRNYPQCYGIQHVCPSSCPYTCEVDCVTCRPVCSCDRPGAVCQDPRFIGGDGITFYFHGKKDKSFCLVTDPNLHINAHFIGKRNENMKRDFTWVQSIGVLFGDHRIFLGAQKTATWDSATDRIVLSFDGEPIVLPTNEGATWQSKSLSSTVVKRDGNTNSITIEVDGLLKISAKVVPITKRESDVHNYGITDDDCFAHLELGFKFYSVSEKMDGVLGQTYRSGYVSRAKMGVAMPVLGGERAFKVSNLFASDCSVSKFEAGKMQLDSGSILELPSMKCGSGIGGRGVVCKR